LTICADGVQQTVLQSSNIGGLGVVFRWYRNAVLVQSGASNTITLNSVAQSGNYTVEVVGVAPSNCVSLLSAPVAVLIRPLPSVVSVTGGGAVCSGNPAPDIVFTFSGTTPLNFTIDVNPGADINVTNHGSLTFTIVAPNPGVNTTYQVSALTDANGCVGSVLGGSASVTVSAVPPPTVESFNASAPVCDDGVGTIPPVAILNLLPNSVQNYDVTYTINGNTFNLVNVASNASGEITINPPYTAWGSVPGSFPVTVTALRNTVTQCAGAVPFNSSNLIVNPRPTAPTNPVAGVACSSSAFGSPISVDAPPVNFTVVWSSTAAPTFTAAVGTTSGTRGNTFTPTSTATTTYHAFTRADLAPTNCLSAASTSVQHTQDQLPTASIAGGAQANCTGTFTLAANLPNAGAFEVGTWTVPGIAYQQLFNYASGTTTSAAVNGWTRNVSGAGVFAGGTGTFQVNGANQFEANNTDGTGSGGAEVVWESPVINVAAMPGLNVSIDLSSSATLEAADYIRVFTRINGGAEVALPVNGNLTGNIAGTVTATASGLTGTTIQLIVRASNSAADEFYRFDNILIRQATGPTITNLNDRAAVVTGLPIGANVLTWTITSRFGVCPPSATNVTLTRHPLPTVNNLTPVLCEDQPGGSGISSGVDLPTLFNTAVMGGSPPNTSVEYYSNAARTAGFLISSPINVTNTQTVFTRVRNTVTTCTSDGTIIFTVRSLPARVNQTVQICEDTPPGSLIASGINLQTFETAIAGGSLVNRDIEWYEDAALTTLIPAGAAIGAEQNYNFNADKTIHAKIIDTGSPTVPPCFSQATLTLDYQARPNNNQITDGIGQVLGATYTVCASSNLVLLQINPGLNPGATYTWTIPPPSYVGEFELLTGTSGFFVILRFPNAIPGGGTLYPTGLPITVKETLGTALCDGNTINTRVIVEGSPPQPIIAGPSSVCSGDNGLVYSVTNPVAGTYSWTLPAGATITSLPVTASTITVQMSTFSGNVGVTHASGVGCTSPAAVPFPVAVVPRPTITSVNTATVCSGSNVSAAHTLTANIVGTTYNWEVINVTGGVTGSILGDAATGVLSINQTLSNTSGVAGSVIYRVTPIGPAPDNCPGTPQNFTVLVNPAPVITAGQTRTICSGSPAGKEIFLSPGNLPAGTLFNWPDPDGAGPATAGTNIPMGVAGTIHINDVLVNLTNAPITVDYQITPSSGAACIGATTLVSIVVNPQPVGFADVATICSGSPVTYDLDANVSNIGSGGNGLIAGTSYSWVALANGNVTGESTSAQSGKFITDILRNVTTGNQVVTYNVTPMSSAGCLGAPFTVNVTVQPEPRGFNDTPAPICSDASVGYNIVANISNVGAGGNNLTAGTTYTWIAASNLNVTGESTTTQAGSTITDVLNNVTNSAQVVVYTVTPTSAAGCPGVPFTVTITVRPEPRGFDDNTPIICSDATVNYNLEANILNTGLGGNGLISGTTYSWVATANGNVGGEGSGTTSTITDVLNNITGVNQTVIYTVTPTSGNGCVGNPFTVSVTVRPEPRGFNDNTPLICSDGAVNYSLNANINNLGSGGNGLSAGTTYSWVAIANANVGGESTTPQAGSTITDILNNVTNSTQVVVYNVVPTSVNGCVGDMFTVSVSVNPEPRGFDDTTPVACSGANINYNLTSNIANTGLGGNNLTAGTTYSWIATSNATVTGESTVAQAGSIITDVITNITNSNQVVVYTVTPTSSNGCVGNPFVISVTVRPEPRGFNDNSPVACSDAPVNYNLSANIANTGLGGNNLITGTTYSWQAADNLNVTGESTTTQTGGTIGDIITNNTAGVEVVTYTVTPTSADGCIGSSFTVSVAVRPEPRGFNDNTPITCSDLAFNYDLAANIANVGSGGNNLVIGTTYSWVAASNTNVSGESILAQTGATITDVLNNVTSSNQTVVYTVTPTSSNGCVGNPFTVSVTVRPEPRGFNDATPVICSDASVGYNLATNIGNTGAGGNNVVTGNTYTWIAASNTNVSGESTSLQAGGTITDVLNNVTNANQVVVYTVVATSADGCVGDPFTVSVTVRPEPRGFNDASPVICSDANVNYDLVANIANVGLGGNSVVTGTTYSWIAASNGNVTGESTSAASGNIINDVLNNVTNGNEQVIYTVTPTSVNGCVGNPFTVTVTVRPEPRGFNDNTPVTCSDVAFNYDLSANIANIGSGGNNLITGTTYSWIAASNANVSGESTTPQSGSIITDILNNVTASNQSVVYSVTPTSANGCVGNPFTVTIQVQPEPRGFNDATPLVCSDVPVNYNLQANVANTGLGGNNLVTGTTYSWVANANGNVAGESTTPQAGASITDVLTNVTNTNQIVVYTVTPTSANACVGNPFTVSVTVRPEPRGFNDNSPIVCSDVSINYSLNANISNIGLGGNNLIAGTTYSWLAASNTNVTGESTSAQTGSTINDVVTNITNGDELVVYTVTPTSSDGCVGDVFTVTVTVRPEPRGFNDNTPVTCSDVAFNYDIESNIANTGLGGNNLITGTTYSWIATANANVTGESTLPQTGSVINDILNNVTATNQVVNYTITPTSANGCVGNPFTVSVTVNPEPRGFNDSPVPFCSDGFVNYNLQNNIANTGLGGNNLVAGTTYSWIAASNANVTGESTVAQTGTTISDQLNNVTNVNQQVVYTVTPTSSIGCVGNPFTVTVTVRPEPRGFDDATPVICSDASVGYNLANNIANVGSGGNNLVAGTTYSWLAADNASVTGESTLIAGTTSTITDVLNNVTNTNQTVVYTVTPTSSDGCIGNSFLVTVTVQPEPRGFNHTALACSDVAFNYDLQANIANTGSGGNNLVTGTTYGWVATANANVTGEGSGVGATITDVLNNVTNVNQVVIYTVTPTSALGCVGNTFTVSVTVQPEPRGFNDNSRVICSKDPAGYDLSANIANVGSGGNNLVVGTTYTWSAAANANVSGESTTLQAGAIITDPLVNITNVNQIVVYTVTPTSANGCEGNSFIVSITVRPEPRGFNDARTICSDANANYDLTSNIGNTGSGGNNLLIGTTYSWIATDNVNVSGETTVTPGTTSLINDVLNNVTNVDQTVVYTVTATSNNGCQGDPFTVSITVRPEPRGFNDNSPIICSDDAVNYDLEANIANTVSGGNNLITGTTYSWLATSNPNVSGESTIAQTGSTITDILNNVTNSNQIVTYAVTPTSQLGCIGNVFTVAVTVRPEPRGFNDTNPLICSNATVNYSLSSNIANTGSGGNNLVAGTTYSWVATDNPSVSGETLAASTATIINDLLVNVTGTNQVVVYTVTPTSALGCLGDNFTVSVTVRPQPIGAADVDAVCSDEAISYNIQTRNINILGNSVSSQFTYTVVSSDPGNVSAAGRDRAVASNAPITDSYTNTTSADVTLTYTITPFSSAGGCQGDPFDVVFTIHPEPLGPNTTISRCSDIPVNFDLQDVINTVGTGNSVPSKFRYTVSSSNPLVVPPGANRITATSVIISDVYTNLSNAPVDVTYTVTPISLANDCEGTPFTLRVTVQPEPVGANVVDPVCSTTLNYNIQTQNINSLGNALPSVFTYVVSSTDPVGVPPAANRVIASNAPITDNYVNSTGVDVTITYTITPFSAANNCEGSTFTYSVTISSRPVGASVTKADVCSDVPFSFNPQADITNGVISTFTWTATYDGGLSVGGSVPPASGSGIINGSLTNTGATVLNAVYRVTPTAGSCPGIPFDITVPIRPEPVVSPLLSRTVCSGDPYATNLDTDGISIGAATYDVTAVADPLLIVGTLTTGTGLANTALAGDVFRNETSVPRNVVYTVTANGVNGCLGLPSRDIVLTVNPEPVVSPGLDNTVCSREIAGIQLNTNGTSAAAASYRLISVNVPGTITADPANAVPGGFVAGAGGINLIRNDKYINQTANPVVVTYEVQAMSLLNCDGAAEFIDLTIDPEPILTPGVVASCSDVASGVILAGGTVAISQYELTGINKPTALIAAPGNAILGQTYLTNNFLANDAYTNTTFGPLNVVYSIIPISPAGCRGVPQTLTYTINPAPAVASLSAIVCSEDATNITLREAPGSAVPDPNEYIIDNIIIQAGLIRTAGNATVPRSSVSDTDILGDRFRNPTNGALTVTYQVRAQTAAGCISPVRDIVLTVEPIIRVNDPVDVSICSGSATSITLTSPTVPSSGPVTFNYTAAPSTPGMLAVTSLTNLPQGHIIQDIPVNNTNVPQTIVYTITPVAIGAKGGAGCISVPAVEPQTVTITVEPKPRLTPTRTIQTVCEGSAITGVTLNSTTTPSLANAPVEFEVMSVIDIATNAPPATVTGFSGVGATFAPGQALADILANNTSTPQTIRYTFRPQFANGLACTGDLVNIDITVTPRPVLANIPQPADVCSNGQLEINMSTDTDPLTTLITWTVATSVPSPDLVGAGPGAGNQIFQTLINRTNVPQTVTYTITPKFNNCDGASQVVVVTVNPLPVVNPPARLTVCGGDPFVLDLLPFVNTNPAQTTFDWTVTDINGLGVPLTGAGTGINQPLSNPNDFTATLIYTVTPIGPGGCRGLERNITVSVAPVIDARFVTTSDGFCEGTPIFLTFEIDGQAPFNFVYREIPAVGPTVDNTVIGSGNVRVIQVNPTVSTRYEIISATDALNCSRTFAPRPTVDIEIYRTNTANWTASVPPLIGGLSTVTFTNTSTILSETDFRFEWDFGTDASPTPATHIGMIPPPVTYNRQGDHFVTLRIVNTLAEADGKSCEAFFSNRITIPVLPLIVDFEIDPVRSCVPASVVVTENNSTGDVMRWELRNQFNSVVATSQLNTPLFEINSPGQYVLVLETSDSFGASLPVTNFKEFEVFANPTANFTARPEVLFVPDTELTTFNFSSGATSYQWDFGDGSTSTEEEPKYTYRVEGLYDIRLIAETDYGQGLICRDTIFRQVTAKQGGITKIPNAFTPSPDGPGSSGTGGNGTFNDVFLPFVKGVEEFNLQIYDRWGNLVFESTDSNRGWDGYDKNGRLMPAGVYVYKLVLRLSDGQRTTQVGDVTMIR
jgi:gliding motility-associated-like protein